MLSLATHIDGGNLELALLEELGREADGIVEGQTERLVRLLAALAAVEEVALELVDNVEEGAARLVSCGVHAVRTRNAARERG